MVKKDIVELLKKRGIYKDISEATLNKKTKKDLENLLNQNEPLDFGQLTTETPTISGSTYSQVHYDEYNRTGDKNIFEEVIDSMMLDGYPQEFKDKVMSMSLKEKRMAILSLLDKDRNLFMKIKSLVGTDISKMEHIKDVVSMLRAYVKVGEVERKQFGEVMTPLELVKEMLATLPVDVWSNPDLKWLDSCNGAGAFLAMIVWRLMEGLKEWEPDHDKRYKHIVENMIYAGELQPKNMFLWMVLADPLDEFKLNVYTGSFLESGFDKHTKDVWGLDKFDIIVGNPPYNTATIGGNGARDLWDKFIIKSESTLVNNGYLVYVHPSKWRSPESKLFSIFKQNNLIYLEIHSDQDGQRVFNAITRFDWYLLQKGKYSGKTIVVDELGVKCIIDIEKWLWLPNYNFDLIGNIISNNNKNDNIIYSSSIYDGRRDWMSKIEDVNHKYPCVYGMYNDNTCSYYYSSENKGHFGIPKVILGIGRYLYPLIDMDGKYGMMNNAFAISVSSIEEANNIKKAIESDKFKEIIKSTKWSNFQTSYKMFKSFKGDFWKSFV